MRNAECGAAGRVPVAMRGPIVQGGRRQVKGMAQGRPHLRFADRGSAHARMPTVITRRWCVTIVLGLAAAFTVGHAQELPTGQSMPAGAAPSAPAVKACLGRADAGSCLDALFGDFLKTHT